MKRAMTDSAKAEKAKLILDAAYALYKKRSFDEIKMTDIAKAARVSNGTLFFYYSTKETLFMEIMFLEYEKRFQRFESLLLSLGTMSFLEFKRVFLQEMESILDENSVLIRLSAIKSTILEKNIDHDTAVKITLGLFASLEKIVQLLNERLEFFTTEFFYELLQAQNAIIVGYVNAASMPDVIHRVILDHKLDGFRVDFKKNALTAMEYYLDGLHERQKSNASG